jgi:hypothetical protein
LPNATLIALGGVILVNTDYQNFSYDLAGAISKNRFRNELLWGLSKLLEIYEEKEEFTMVFDYVCDIEIHDNNKYEFYQVKTKKQGRPYSIREITENKSGLSILGKLYILKHNFNGNHEIKLAVVSNAPLTANKKEICYLAEKEITAFGDNEVNSICSKLHEEVCAHNSECHTVIDLNKIFYIHTSMNLHNPSDELLGKLITFFDKVGRGTPKKPKVLLQVLESEISGKACFEVPSDDYDDLIKNKGMTKNEFTNILDQYTEIIDVSVEKSLNFIETEVRQYSDRRELQLGLTKIVTALKGKNSELVNLEIKIVDYIRNNKLMGTQMDAIDQIFSEIKEMFSVEYSESEIWTFILLVLSRDEEGFYE